MGVDKFIQNQADGRGELANVAPIVDKLHVFKKSSRF